MTLQQDLLSTSRTIYERHRHELLAEMKLEAQKLSADGSLLAQGHQRDAHWRRLLSEACRERDQRDQAIREFCRRSDGAMIQSEAHAR
ncbi:MAG TPA: hypothetical protein VGX76_04590 [Pirellulales bacterium]|jgi:hypothetical protein|nr:hypothetical protein [Pirellulales bacterium]